MKLSISNLAWKPEDYAQVIPVLTSHGIDAIEIAPAQIFDDVDGSSPLEWSYFADAIRDDGLEISGLQGIFHNSRAKHLYDPAAQERLLKCLVIAELLDAPHIVLGAPKLRKMDGMTYKQVYKSMREMLMPVLDEAAYADVKICLEANPKMYGGEFFTDFAEVLNFTYGVNHPNLVVQIDTGECFANKVDPSVIFKKYGKLIEHVHLSVPHLKSNFGDFATEEFINTVYDKDYDKYLVIETKLPANADSVPFVKKSIDLAVQVLGK